MFTLKIKVQDDLLITTLSQQEMDAFLDDFKNEDDFIALPVHNKNYHSNVVINKLQVVYYTINEVK